MKIKELFENETLHSIKEVKSALPQIVQTVQTVYDNWDENEDEYAGGGICHLIADEVAGILNQKGIDAASVSNSIGEQHVWVVFKVLEGVYTLDIPPNVYERGAGYNWTKIPDVIFDVNDIFIDRLSANPENFDQYID